ncbi:MAG: hypothetical protein F6J97_23505 [Leptolyngbya sp. SIO4C1]|nr:hypothetical protein [Leptolyngbya sp. SIO4C1]
MYNRYGRYGRGSWYQAFFWILVGFLIGQIIRLDIKLAPRQSHFPQSIEHIA